jgi:aminomethyltransferase
MTEELRQLPLAEVHREAGARFGAFAGWSMPLTYPAGVMQEHQHTRAHAGLFDISHMKLVEISGADAQRLLAHASPLEPDALRQGQGKYSFLLNDEAGILDDIIVTRLGPDRYMVVVNAGNADADIAHYRRLAAGLDVKIDPLERVFLALQGPDAAGVLAKAGLDGSGLGFMTASEPRPGWFLSRSGYTGEDGFEIGVPVADGAALAASLLSHPECGWAGLAARDSLRLEAGLCLHGQDIDPTTNPVDAGLLWAIPKPLRQGGDYAGAAALARAIERGPVMRRVGLKPAGRQPVRAGAQLFDAAGEPAGRVTSGGFGPSVGHPVAMGYVRPDLAAPGTELAAEVRGNRVALAVHPLPFTPHRYHKG